mgnify:CR=1 FL=1
MCGIFGVQGHADAANLPYLGLYALQHRGQESAGIVATDGRVVRAERGMGHVAEIFSRKRIERLPGTTAIGHTRYSTAGHSVLRNAQPIVVQTSMGPLALVHNGNLVNAAAIREQLEAEGSIFQTTSDSEVILHLMARNPRAETVESLRVALEQVEGAYSLLLLTSEGVIAARDPHGFRPLALGSFQGGAVFASETCAFDLMQAEGDRELLPGEIVAALDGQEIRSLMLPARRRVARCVFEQIYFSRPDSRIFGDDVSAARLAMGRKLAEESPVVADLVVPVPDSGLFAAMGFSRQSGIPFELGLIRNHYVGRTFIEPKQSIRDFGVRVKLNPVTGLIQGRRVVLLDDSIVRGTTSRKIVRMVREAGAREVHLRITSPPTAYPCHYGINTPTREELIASSKTLEEIRDFTEADSLAYLSLEGLFECVSGAPESYCTACWTGSYPVVPSSTRDDRQGQLFTVLADGEDEMR